MAKSKVKWNTAAVARLPKRGRTKIQVFQGEGKRLAGGKVPYKKGRWYFRLVAGNGEIIAQSEGYTRRFTAEQGAKRVLAAQ